MVPRRTYPSYNLQPLLLKRYRELEEALQQLARRAQAGALYQRRVQDDLGGQNSDVLDLKVGAQRRPRRVRPGVLGPQRRRRVRELNFYHQVQLRRQHLPAAQDARHGGAQQHVRVAALVHRAGDARVVHFVETLHGLVAVVLSALQQVMHGHGAAVVVDVVAALAFPFFSGTPFFGAPCFLFFLFFLSPAKVGSLEMQPGAKLQAYLGVIILQPHARTQRFRLRILRRTRSNAGRTSARSLSGRIESIWETPSKERDTRAV